MFRRKNKKHDLGFEESLGDSASDKLEVMEVPLGNRPLIYLGGAIFLIGLTLAGRIAYLDIFKGDLYRARAEDNIGRSQQIAAPRGLIYDRQGKVLAENAATFTATLDLKQLLANQGALEPTLQAIEDTLAIPKETVLQMIQDSIAQDFAAPVILKEDLTQSELVHLRGLNLPAILIQNDFQRRYAGGSALASVLGYVGRVSSGDLERNPQLSPEDFVGKAGIESFYNNDLRGEPGSIVALSDARGKILSEEKKSDPKIGKFLRLTIDSEFQNYFYQSLAAGLARLGRRIGLGLAINPQNGEVLAMVNLPSFDNNLLSGPGNNVEKIGILNSPDKPLFDRAVSGYYSPGSTIKPLVGVAALAENVIDPKREIFSPGYLLVPNPYSNTSSSRYLDWRPQGNVNLASAIAQSSDVYFYIVGGGSPAMSTPPLNDASDYGIAGLGVTRLHNWWERFGLGKSSGIDMPNEAKGFLPTPDWKQSKFGTPWLLGDTYNVSIGQGDLLLSPLQLLNYIDAIANGGKIYRPFLNASSTPQIIGDLSSLLPEMKEVQKGMRATVTSPMGTAYTLNNLPFPVCAKTGSAQVQNNAQENALFVGYTSCDNPQIAILILIENSREGSLNAVPIAKDVLNWYYWNRMQGKASSK